METETAGCIEVMEQDVVVFVLSVGHVQIERISQIPRDDGTEALAVSRLTKTIVRQVIK